MMHHPSVIALFALLMATLGESANLTCRFGTGWEMEPSLFKTYACCNCYNFVFRLKDGLAVGTGHCNFATRRIEDGTGNPARSAEALPSNRDAVCEMANSKYKCQMWVDCCQSAIECCDDMIDEQLTEAAEDGDGELSSESPTMAPDCPSTWDSLKCWKKSKPFSNPRLSCPALITDNVKDCVDPDVHYVERECMENGTWNASLSRNTGESSYIFCADVLDCYKDVINAKHIIEITCEILSLLAVIPAITIFFAYRTLYSQHRIKIHINLFIALALYDIVHLIYEMTVRHPDFLSEMLANNPIECRVLNALTKFTTLSMFIWMMMEGFYLHWLMVNTFKQTRLLYIFLTGWGTPVVVTAAYVTVKSTHQKFNTGCWFAADKYSWIINGPLIACLLANILFLINIMRVIVTKLTSNSNEPSYYRRAVKATAILVPPFGLLLVFTLYSPNPEEKYRAKMVLDCVAAAVQHLQGLIISIILCYSNGEVLGNLRKTFSPFCPCQGNVHHRRQESMMTGVTHLSAGRTSVTVGADSPTLTVVPTAETKLLAKHSITNGEGNNNSDVQKPL